MLLNEKEAKALTDKILSYVSGSDASVSVSSDRLLIMVHASPRSGRSAAPPAFRGVCAPGALSTTATRCTGALSGHVFLGIEDEGHLHVAACAQNLQGNGLSILPNAEIHVGPAKR